jgi:hypothetical protein
MPLRILWHRSRKYRRLLINVNVEPAAKGRAGKRSVPGFQCKVMNQTECCRAADFRRPTLVTA